MMNTSVSHKVDGTKNAVQANVKNRLLSLLRKINTNCIMSDFDIVMYNYMCTFLWLIIVNKNKTF